MAEEFLYRLDALKSGQMVGNKAASLQRLRKLGISVPLTYVLTADAYSAYLRGDATAGQAVLAEIERKLDLSKTYAVRSSANLEDGAEHSFAGQFLSVLDVRGKDALMQAVVSVWEATQTSAVREYLIKRGIPAEDLRMAVIIQEMVEPIVSGVAFSRNPITGMFETVIEAVEGPGTRLVQEGITPLRWIFRSGMCASAPDASPLPERTAAQVAGTTALLARKCKKALDLEWVYDGESVQWVQMREITSLQNVPLYSNRISREMIGGIIKPLIWSVNIPMVIGAKLQLLTEMLGPTGLSPQMLAKSFHYRVYFNMSLIGQLMTNLGMPAEALEMMLGVLPKGSGSFKMRPNLKMLRILPRTARSLWDKWTLVNRLEARMAAMEAAFKQFDYPRAGSLSPAELVSQIDKLYALNHEAAYYNILIPMLMHIYNAVLRGQVKKKGVDPARLDMRQRAPEADPFNPNGQLERLNRSFLALAPDLQEYVRSASYAQVMADDRLGEFRAQVAALMQRFGHLADNGNDFSTVPWRENQDTILRLIADFQVRAEEPGVEKIPLEALKVPFWQAWMLRRLYHRARMFMLYREHISYHYSYGYGLFRPYFSALGTYFVDQGWIDQPDDIYYLEWEAIRTITARDMPEGDLRPAIEGHKLAIENSRGAVLPEIIYGDQAPPVENHISRRLTGIATSRGYCTSRVKVVHGLQDFVKMNPGDVLVIPFSDVGWTPLFACAAGVIAESGGMLSHSSIIAREYGIPAVVSVPYAMQLADDTLVTIDGYKGEIIVHEEEDYRAAEGQAN